MKISLSKKKQGVLSIVGHVGCGHCHSHNLQVQDDSAGLATVLALFQEATGLSLVIKDIRVKNGSNCYIEVETMTGGIGKATARRGITIHEKRLAQSLIGKEAICTQTLVLEAFGRFYGQGIHETPVALQTAIANAALDSFVKNYPSQFKYCFEELEGSCGLIAGTVLDIDQIPVSVLGTVNASIGGIGPNEDMEGNAAIGKKRDVMADLGMLKLPTIVIESKIYTKYFSHDIDEFFLVRADKEADNPFVSNSILNAAKKLGYNVSFRDDVMARSIGDMSNKTKQLGEKIIELGLKLKSSEYSQEKVNILAELASLVSQDGAGISFMTNKVHEILGGAGMMPGTSAVINYVVSKKYYEEYLFPFITDRDLHKYVSLTKLAVKEIYKVLPEAIAHAQKNCYVGSLDKLVKSME